MFYVVEESFVVNVNPEAGTVEMRTPEGEWVPYTNLADIMSNGRVVEEEEANSWFAERHGEGSNGET